jgi:hypothetical protein
MIVNKFRRILCRFYPGTDEENSDEENSEEENSDVDNSDIVILGVGNLDADKSVVDSSDKKKTPKEASVYPMVQEAFSAFANTLYLTNGSLVLDPQPNFGKSNDGSSVRPDHALMIYYDKYKDCAAWMEVKPPVVRPSEDIWTLRDPLEHISKHLRQVNIQASAILNRYPHDTVYCWLIIGTWFSILKYEREMTHPEYRSIPKGPNLRDPNLSKKRSSKKRRRPLVSDDSDSAPHNVVADEMMKPWSRYQPIPICCLERMVNADGSLTAVFVYCMKNFLLPKDVQVQSRPFYFEPEPEHIFNQERNVSHLKDRSL